MTRTAWPSVPPPYTESPRRHRVRLIVLVIAGIAVLGVALLFMIAGAPDLRTGLDFCSGTTFENSCWTGDEVQTAVDAAKPAIAQRIHVDAAAITAIDCGLALDLVTTKDSVRCNVLGTGQPPLRLGSVSIKIVDRDPNRNPILKITAATKGRSVTPGVEAG